MASSIPAFLLMVAPLAHPCLDQSFNSNLPIFSDPKQVPWGETDPLQKHRTEARRSDKVNPATPASMDPSCSSTDFNLCDFPFEVLLNILSFLPVPSLCIVATTCTTLKEAALFPSLWPIRNTVLPCLSGELPSPRVCSSSVIIGSKMYIFGGHCPSGSKYIGSVSDSIFIYDLENLEWKKGKIQLPSRTEHAACRWRDKILHVGGSTGTFYTNSIIVYNPEDETYTTMITRGTAPVPKSAQTALVWDDKLYQFGGWDGFHSSDDLHVCDMETGEWRPVARKSPWPSSRRSHNAVIYKDAMYVVFGYCRDTPVNSDIWKFDFSTELWSIVPVEGLKPSPRSRAASVRYGTKWAISGGWDRTNYFNDWWEFDFETLRWSRQYPDLPNHIGQHSMCLYQNKALIWAGYDQDGNRPTSQLISRSLGYLRS